MSVVVQPLCLAVSDASDEVRSAAEEALEALGSVAVEPLITVAAEADDEHMRDVAHEALAKLPPPEDIPRAMARVVKRWYRSAAWNNWNYRRDEAWKAFSADSLAALSLEDRIRYGVTWKREWEEKVERICDDGNEVLRFHEGYWRSGGYLACERCTDYFLNEIVRWDEAIQDVEAYQVLGCPGTSVTSRGRGLGVQRREPPGGSRG